MSEQSAVRPRASRAVPAGALLVIGMALTMWVVEIADFLLPWSPDFQGILPRTLSGLDGIIWSPFLHGDFAHLMSNTVPLIVLGLLVAWRSGRSTWKILLFVIAVGGLGVWLLAPSNVVTIGASGLVFGLLGYLLAAGIISRRVVDILLSVGVLMAYGSLLWGTTPFGVPAGVSWLAHLTGFTAGIVAAVLFAPRRRAAAALPAPAVP